MAFYLANNADFNSRVRACMWQQAQTYQDDPDPANAAMAKDLLRGSLMTIPPMVNMIAAFPGLADGVTITLGDGTQMVDQSGVTDGDILAQTQANWNTIATLFFPPPPPANLG
jgi:hypothetical protein